MSEQGKQYEPRRICAGDGVEVWAWYAGGSDPSGPYELPPDVFAELVPPVVPGWPDAVAFPSREAAIAALERATREAKGEGMSERAAHTPGPWESGGEAKIALTFDREANIFPPSAGAGEYQYGGSVAVVAVSGIAGGEANAALIAAAPDLLVACETVATALQWYAEQDPTGTLAVALSRVTAAARKARGQS